MLSEQMNPLHKKILISDRRAALNSICQDVDDFLLYGFPWLIFHVFRSPGVGAVMFALVPIVRGALVPIVRGALVPIVRGALVPIVRGAPMFQFGQNLSSFRIPGNYSKRSFRHVQTSSRVIK